MSGTPAPRPNDRERVDAAAGLTAELPIVLLPVRIETRFAPVQRELRVRIYPDEIAGVSHEPALLARERDAGLAYWRLAWDETREPVAWRALVAAAPAPRAAWIVRVTTPTNVADRPSGEPAFPDVTLHEGSWTGAVRTNVLPDRWVVRLYRDGALQHQAVTVAVPDPLALSVDPSADPAGDVVLPDEGDGLSVDPELAWTLDFDRAVAAGMAVVVVALTDDDLAHGFDRVLVAGVRASLDPGASAERLAALLEGHHYDRGWSFVRQGTPTNNTAEAGSGYPPPDPNGSVSFAVERGGSLVTEGSDGARFALALGVEREVVAHISRANGREHASSRAMAEALFPATLGFFLEQLMHPVFDAPTILGIRDYLLESVRARGPLPAFRVGSVPYGLLPVGVLDRWEEGLPAPSEGLSMLRRLRDLWMAQVSRVPRIGRSGDPDLDLVETLAMDASAQEVWVRLAWGPDFQSNLVSFLGGSPEPWFGAHVLIARLVGAAIGHPEWFPRLARLTFDQQSYRYAGPVVADPLAENAPLDFNYIRWIRLASVDDLRNERFPEGVSQPAALLYRVLRHAALTVYAHAAFGLHLQAGTVTEADRVERELVGVADGAQSTVWDRFAAVLPDITGTATVAEYVLTEDQDPQLLDVATFRAALERLEGLPTAELDRLATETLDICSHRLDAWITGLFSRRLDELRGRRPGGCHLGGFAWVEDLRPTPTQVGLTSATGRSEGYVHAPSMAHAATAAILRNAYLSRFGAERSRYALDLSSARVRDALFLLDGVREGQPLGAVLGYRFERGLHEGHPGLELDKYIDVFHGLYPIVADKLTNDGAPAEEVAARNVVDGLALRTAWREGHVPFGQHGLPASGADRDAIEAELRALDDVVDSVTDLLTAESVFQLARGNATASAAALDALARATRPPEPGVAAQPRGGTTYTQRLAILIGGDPPAAPRWAAIAATPRSRAEPALDAWVAGLLGDPANVRCSVRYQTASNPGTWVDGTIRLDQLDLRPLDVQALAREPAAPAAGRSELDVRIADAAEDSAGETLVALDIAYVPPALPESRTFPEVVELARSVNDFLAAARPLRPDDLVVPERGGDVPDASRLPAEAESRASAAVHALTSARDDLRSAVDAAAAAAPNAPFDLTALRRALRRAALFGVSGAFPTGRFGSSAASRAELVRRGRSVVGELDGRVKRAASGSPEDRVRAVFGRDFPWLPRFSCSDSGTFAAALTEGPGLGADAHVLGRFFQQAAAVRAPLARWREAAILARASAGARLPLEVVQLPTGTGQPWVGLPFATEEDRPAGGALSIVWHRAQRPAVDVPWVGLLVDEWTEVIPTREEQTAVAFHYDDPGAEAAQAVLLAVAPPAARTWSLDLLFETLADTLDRAKLRLVEPELLGELGQLLPALYLTANSRRETVSTELRSQLVGAERIAAPEA